MSRVVRVLLLLLVLGLAFSTGARGQTLERKTETIGDPEWLRTLLERERVAHRLPAIAAALVVDGKVLVASAVGVRKSGSPVPVQRNDAFHLGSLAEAMSATLFGLLVDQRQLRWDMTMTEMFPELAQLMQPSYQNVTIAQLLSHTGGFPEKPEMSDNDIDSKSNMVTGRRYEYVKAVVEDPPAAPPGTKAINSGGSIIVASAVERRTHQSYERMMQRLLFKPIGMTHAGFGCMASEGKIDGPWGHSTEGGEPTPVPPNRSQAIQTRAPAGRNIHASIIDLARFAALHVQGARGQSQFLRRETFQRLQNAEPGGLYSPAWVIDHPDWYKGMVLAQRGATAESYATMSVFPKEGFAICVMTNAGGEQAGAACDWILDWIVARFHRKRLIPDGSLATRPAPPRPDVTLESLTPTRATTGFGKINFEQTAVDTPFRLDGITYAKGVGVHANSELIYDLKPEYRRFVAQVGIDDKQMMHGTVVVKVYAGEKLLLESGLIRGGDSPWSIDVALPKMENDGKPGRLRLVVDSTSDGINQDLTDWIHAGFLLRSL